MKKHYAIVVSRFNRPITDKLLEGAVTQLMKQGVAQSEITVQSVPGAVEIPLTVQVLAKSKRFDAIIALGCVIRGDTSHYDYVCDQVSQGCQRVMLDQDLPIIFGVLTTENEEQAFARVGGSEGHKGMEAADAALEMVEIMEKWH